MRKKNRILELYNKPPAKSSVICYDEWGPLELKPIHASQWAERTKPRRLRANYTRHCGTEQMLAFYDVHNDCLAGTIHKRKRIPDVLSAFKRLRKAYPFGRKLFVIMDNLLLHKSKIMTAFYKLNNIEPVWTPTYSSWLNVIEPHFGVMKKFTLNGSDDQDHVTRRKRIYRYLRWRNRSVQTDNCKLATVFNH